MTAVEAYELTTHGGATDFARIVAACDSFGPWCLIGGLAVNHYVEPVYTLDADIVVIASRLRALAAHLRKQSFQVAEHAHSVNAQPPSSDLRIRFTTDPPYQEFLARSNNAIVLRVTVKVACLEDVAQGKLWAWRDLSRYMSKRKKDELDLTRLAEAHPQLLALYPEELRRLFDRG